jgi:hypothetical protein
MTITDIRTQSEQWTDLNPQKLYQGHVANEQAAMVKRLLRVVDALSTNDTDEVRVLERALELIARDFGRAFHSPIGDSLFIRDAKIKAHKELLEATDATT